MIHLDFPASVIKTVFSAVEEYKETGGYPPVEEDVFFEIIPLVLELQIDSFIIFLAPLIGQNITKLSDKLINLIPRKIIPIIVDNIPISVIDPDFFINHFGVNELIRKMEISYIWTNPLNQFSKICEYNEENPVCKLANTFVNLSYSRFGNSQFVKQNATMVWTKTPENFQEYQQLRLLKIYNGDQIYNLRYSLTNTITRLEINQCHLGLDALKQLFDEFLPTSNVVFLSLRENRIGPKGCALLTNFLRKNPRTSLQFIDIGLNSIGADEISRFLDIASMTTLKGVCIDGNFFRPSSNELGNLMKLRMPFLSIRALHWDDATVNVIKLVIERDSIEWLDLSAQVIHQNSDPDLSGPMAEQLFEVAAESIKTLIFANHRLEHINYGVFAHLVNLKYLNLANSTLNSGEIDALCPILNTLERLDLSYNNINFRTNTFLTCCAESKSLRNLNLTNNNIVSKNFNFFDELKKNSSPITKLGISNCGLKQKQSPALLELLASGVMHFEELDISSNDLLHVKQNVTLQAKTFIEKLNVSGNQQKFEAFEEFLSLITGVKYIDMDYVPFSIASKVAYLLKGVACIRISFVNNAKLQEIIKLIQDSQCHVLWAYNSISARVFQQLMLHWAEIPSLLYMHTEDGKQPLESTKIPLMFEEKKR